MYFRYGGRGGIQGKLQSIYIKLSNYQTIKLSNYQTIEYWQDIPVVDVFISNFWKVYYCQLDCSELLMYVLFGLPNGQAGSSHY